MSKELTPLEALKSFLGTRGWYDDEFKKRYDLVGTALKALEIIKKKNVDVDFFKYCCQEFNDEVGIEQYNIRHVECSNNGKPLVQEEYDLLKEVLEINE